MARAAQAYEPNQTLINQCLTRNDNENVQFGSLKSLEPQVFDKKQGVALKNTTPFQIGDAMLAIYELINNYANFINCALFLFCYKVL